MSQRVLEGITVLEYARFVAGPYCGRLLADMGAEVVKVEPPEGDESRQHGPFLNDIPDPESSALFLNLNLNKSSVTLEPSTPTGADLFRRLALQADIVIEDTRPGTMESLGLGYPALQEADPGLIYVSITPFGQTGPYAGYTAYDLNIFCSGGEAYSLPGHPSQALFPEREPVRPGAYLAEHDAGVFASMAIVSALLARDMSGLGQHIDLSKQEAAMALGREVLLRYSGYGQVLERGRGGIVGGIFQCRDGYVTLYPREDRHWQGLCEAMGRDDLAADPRFKDFKGRSTQKAVLVDILAEWFRDKAHIEVYHLISEKGCPIGYFASTAEVVASPQLEARGFFAEVEHPHAGRLKYPTAAHQMSETPPRCDRAAPLLGEHNAEIFGDRLGIAPEELAALRRAGVI